MRSTGVNGEILAEKSAGAPDPSGDPPPPGGWPSHRGRAQAIKRRGRPLGESASASSARNRERRRRYSEYNDLILPQLDCSFGIVTQSQAAVWVTTPAFPPPGTTLN